MKKHLIIPIFVLSVSSIFSCNTSKTQIRTETYEQKDGICNFKLGQKFQTNKSEYSGYFEIAENLFINELPGIFGNSFDLSFKIASPTGVLKYKINEGKDKKEFATYVNPIEIKVLDDKNLENYPFTTAVNAIHDEAKDKRGISYDYIENVQKNGHYYLNNRQNVVQISYEDKANKQSYSATLTYLINSDIDFTKIPVVSINVDYEDCMGTKGFYNNFLEDIEKRANLEVFDYKNNEYFSRNSKIKIGGNTSAGFPQKTLNLNFNKDENGDKNKKVSQNIYDGTTRQCDDEVISKITRFRLHNGGHCFESYTGINDALLQSFARGMNCGSSAFRPCITYINGEYWGYYSIREHYSDVYFEDNYGVDKDDVCLVENFFGWTFDDGNNKNWKKYIANLEDYLLKDFSNDTVYQKFIDEYIDVNSLIDAIIVNAYSNNIDYIGNFNNFKMWKTQTIDSSKPYYDGKWRFVLHDIDLGHCGHRVNFLEEDVNYSYTLFPMFKALLKNKNFVNSFINRTEEVMKTYLNKKRCLKIMDDIINEVKPFKKESYLRWGKDNLFLAAWEKNLDTFRGQIKLRDSNFLKEVKETLQKYL